MENKITPEIVSKIFNATEQLDDPEYCQLEFLTYNKNNQIVEELIKKFPICPPLVIQTILMIYDNPSVCNIYAFPYSALTNALNLGNFETIDLIEDLCAERHSIYLNLLSRYSMGMENIESKDPNKGINALRTIESLIKMKKCMKILEKKEIWGLERKRIGVKTKMDKVIEEIIEMGIEINITQINEIIRCLKDGNWGNLLKVDRHKNEQECINDVNRIQGALALKFHRINIQEEYTLPFFLNKPFNLLKGFDKDFSINQNYAVSASIFEESLGSIILCLVHNPSIKENFCALIENVYAQDRRKLKFEPEENATDSFCYLLFPVLLKISKGIFDKKDAFIDQIGFKKFSTFAFFLSFQVAGNKSFKAHK